MKIKRILVRIIVVGFLGACSSESTPDCADISVEDCESQGCVVQTGKALNADLLCLEAEAEYGCVSPKDCEAESIVAEQGRDCVRFDHACLPEGWSTPRQGHCEYFVNDPPACAGAPNCDELAPEDCFGPRCVVLEGRRFVGPMDGIDSAGCFEAPEPLGCMTANSNCPNNIPATLHEGSCYTFQSGCLPKGWEVSSTCPGLTDAMCE